MKEKPHHLWVKVPQVTELAIPKEIRTQVQQEIHLAFVEKGLLQGENKLVVNFRGHFCYVSVQEIRYKTPSQLFRLSYSGNNSEWSVAFYSYGSDKYLECVFPSGKHLGNPSEAVELSRIYL